MGERRIGWQGQSPDLRPRWGEEYSLRLQGDLATAEGTDAVAHAAPEADILVNNAGIFEP